MFNLEGRRALVTGASGGIGAAIATTLHGCGATVVLSGTRKGALDDLAQTLGAGRVHVVVGDLQDPSAPHQIITDAEAAMGGLDILVNNAGLTQDGLLVRMRDDEWDKVLNVNLTAIFKLCRDSLRGMMRQRWGRIINITSVVGTTGNPGQANYAASKAALGGFGKSLAREVASRGITVNSVAPGFIVTSMTDALAEDQKTKLTERIPLGRLGTPEDVAHGVAFLASPAASYITGHTLHINGGMVMV